MVEANQERAQAQPQGPQPATTVSDSMNSSGAINVMAGLLSSNSTSQQSFNTPLFNSTSIIGGTNSHMLEQTNTWHQIESS